MNKGKDCKLLRIKFDARERQLQIRTNHDVSSKPHHNMKILQIELMTKHGFSVVICRLMNAGACAQSPHDESETYSPYAKSFNNEHKTKILTKGKLRMMPNVIEKMIVSKELCQRSIF